MEGKQYMFDLFVSGCSDHCLQCDTPGECNDGQCQEGYIYRSDLKDCKACPPNCNECEFPGGDTSVEPVCTVCEAKFEVKEEEYCDCKYM
jgi:hypothetical protein